MSSSFFKRLWKNSQSGSLSINLIMIVVVGIMAFFLAGGINTYYKKPYSPREDNQTKVVPIIDSSKLSSKALHLKSIAFATVTPIPTVYNPPPPVTTPGPTVPAPTNPPYVPPTPRPNLPGQTCTHYQKVSNGCTCEGEGNYLVDCQNGENRGTQWDPSQVTPHWCRTHTKNADGSFNNGLYCVGKPVIYLYPLYPMLVDVRLTVPGSIIISDPLYDPVNGWEQVLAHPDGSLLYQGKWYKELYYETTVDTVNAPDTGMIIAKEHIRNQLYTAVTKLGLKDTERQEFLEYWLPQLEALPSPYIIFSVLDPVEKERIDHVEISPKPDTMIEFLAYFKPAYINLTELKPLVLPATPPARIGFTAVEWGGTIDYQ